MNQLQTGKSVVTIEKSILDAVLQATESKLAEVVAKTERVYTQKPRETFITDPQKRYITLLRDEARKVGLHTLADKKVHNRTEASDYIRELKLDIAAEKAKPKPCGCGRK